MTSLLEKIFSWCLSFLIFLILIANTASAQWVRVDSSGIPTCFTSDGKYIYAGFHGGYYYPGDSTAARNIIRSSDDGVTWENASNGLTSESMYSLNIESLYAAGNKILTGTRNGIFISSNHGDNWVQTNFDPSHSDVTALLVVDSLIFAGSTDDRIPQKTTPGLFVSADNGQSWVRSDSGIMCSMCGVYPSVYALTRIGSIIFAGTSRGVFSSNNNGKNWIWDSLGVQAISFAVIDSTLFAGGWNTSYVSRSSDLGISWTRCNSGLPDTGIEYLAARAKNLLGGSIFEGVYFSSDMGDHWKPVNEGLGAGRDSNDVRSISIIDNYVFAGTNGIWRRPFSEITSVERLNPVIPKEFELRQNYPNPFNPSTIINYELSKTSDVSLIVYDLLGREIAVLVNKKQTSGEHSVKFSAKDGTASGGNGNFSSGVYFYRLTANGRSVTKKMLLIR